MTNESERLKPCPICGAEPLRNGRGMTGGVLCNGSPVFLHRVQVYGTTQNEADAAWNKRPPPTPSREASEDEVEAVARAIARANRMPRMAKANMTPSEMDDEVHNAWDLYLDEARAALSVIQGREDALREALGEAFMTCESNGHPEPAERSYRLVFRFPTMEKLHEAHSAVVAAFNTGGAK